MKKDRNSKPPLSLRARGVQLLSQREHSVSELGKKLQRHARLLDAAAAAAAPACREAGTEGHYDGEAKVEQRCGSADEVGRDSTPHGQTLVALAQDAPPDEPVADAVADTLLWLQAQGYLSDTRFAQSRVHVRSARFGNLRIRQELAQHQVELTAEAEQLLQNSELERALAVFQRKFRDAAVTGDAAKQARFLTQRGFSFDVVRQVLKSSQGQHHRALTSEPCIGHEMVESVRTEPSVED